jgi:hypothetical protein
MMTTAKDALQELSSDPVAQRLASERETAVLMHRHLINSSCEEGRAEASAGLREAVLAMCEILGLEIDALREKRLSALNCEALTKLVQHLRSVTEVRRAHTASNATPGMSVRMSTRNGFLPNMSNVLGSVNRSGKNSGNGVPNSAIRRGTHPEIHVLRQARVAMRNDRLATDQKIFNAMGVERSAQFDPIRQHRESSS